MNRTSRGSAPRDSSQYDVCMLTTSFPRFAGDLFGSFVFELARELVRQGLSVHVVAPHAHAVPRHEVLEGVQVTRFRYMLPTSWQRLAYGGGIPANLSRSWVARVQVPAFLFCFWWHVVRQSGTSRLFHCHWTISALVGLVVGRRASIPVVLSVRGSDINVFARGYLGALARKICLRVDGVIAVSHDLARKLERGGVAPDKIRVVGNGVHSRFSPLDRQTARRKLSLPSDAIVVLFVGLLVRSKGLSILLDAVEKLADPRLLCALVGEGPLREELGERAAQADFVSPILLCGRRSSEEVPVWMNAADIFVLPSLSEGRPNVVLEAQACGVPVIATDVGGTPELIDHGVNGHLVAPGDAESLADALTRLIGDEDYRSRLGRAARDRVETGGHTWEKAAERTSQIYEEVMGE